MVSQNAFQSVQQRTTEPNRTGGEARLTGTFSGQRPLWNNRGPVTRPVNGISGALDRVAETSIAFGTTANSRARRERFQQGKFRRCLPLESPNHRPRRVVVGLLGLSPDWDAR